MDLRGRLAQIYGNETAFTVGVIFLGLLPVTIVLAVLFLK
jgi:hypothetical protein